MQAEMETINIVPIFCALLYVAQFQANLGGVSFHMIMKTGKGLVCVLNRDLQNDPAKAMRALQKAANTPEKMRFHQVLKGCVPFGIEFSVKGTRKRDAAADRQKDVAAARSQHHGETTAGRQNCCSYPGCPNREEITLKTCPCKTIR